MANFKGCEKVRPGLPVASFHIDVPDLEHPFPLLNIPATLCSSGTEEKKRSLTQAVEAHLRLSQSVPSLLQTHLSNAAACGWVEDLEVQSIEKGFTGLRRARLTTRITDRCKRIVASQTSIRLRDRGFYLIGYGVETILISPIIGGNPQPSPAIPDDFGFLAVALFQSTKKCGKIHAQIIPDSVNIFLPSRVRLDPDTGQLVFVRANFVQRLQATSVVVSTTKNTRIGLVLAAFNNRPTSRPDSVPIFPFILATFNGGMFATQLHTL